MQIVEKLLGVTKAKTSRKLRPLEKLLATEYFKRKEKPS